MLFYIVFFLNVGCVGVWDIGLCQIICNQIDVLFKLETYSVLVSIPLCPRTLE